MPTLAVLRERAFQSQSGRCYYCDCPMWHSRPEEFARRHRISLAFAQRFRRTAEHLIARKDGGTNSHLNIVAACHFCNQCRHRRAVPPGPAEHRRYVQRRLRAHRWHPYNVCQSLLRRAPVPGKSPAPSTD